MGIDDILLPGSVIEKLYHNEVVNLNFVPPSEKKIPYMGKNLRNILIMYDAPKGLNKEESEFLDKLLAACKIKSEDIALVNLNEQEDEISDILSRLKIRHAVFFGIAQRAIGLDTEDIDETVITNGQLQFIKTLPLNRLNTDIQKKKALWTSLQLLFNI